MFLKHRNITAWILLILAALGWAFGLRLLRYAPEYPETGTTFVEKYENTSAVFTAPTSFGDPMGVMEATEYPTTSPIPEEKESGLSPRKLLGLVLCFAAIAAASAAVFVLWQKTPLLGPDGAAVLLAIVGAVKRDLLASDYVLDIWIYSVLVLLTLCAARELWGWLCSQLSLHWCAVHRLAKRCPTPQLSMLVFAGWIVLTVMVIWCMSYRFDYLQFLLTYGCILLCGVFGSCCLWKYGADLHHFQRQLDNFQKGLPITVRDGAFARTEAQLLQVQAQHEEAVRTAVTSERFKVELISNVSHDLRTPLTSILGYGELLRKEHLSPVGQEQLSCLNRKAGYMRELVESLFELTKVSSGVIESKQEQIDLIRLLEQTVGLFDDQLTAAGLLVRRHYEADHVSVITDGARMHQVFANLLGNAIKYALPGTRIYLEVKSSPDSILVRMINTASYEMDFQPEEILQRFARGDKARSTKGSGLGLAIAQTYTQSVGGQFRVAVDGDQFSAIVQLPKTERNL